MSYRTSNPSKALLLIPISVLWIASATAQTTPPSAGPASMPHATMQQGDASSRDMKSSMMMGMDSMQKMQMSGDIDKDFAMMMKMHHQQALNMAEMELAQGKSADMKAMARKISAAQRKEIAQFDEWLAKHK